MGACLGASNPVPGAGAPASSPCRRVYISASYRRLRLQAKRYRGFGRLAIAALSAAGGS